jgi:hypothetical protein
MGCVRTERFGRDARRDGWLDDYAAPQTRKRGADIRAPALLPGTIRDRLTPDPSAMAPG